MSRKITKKPKQKTQKKRVGIKSGKRTLTALKGVGDCFNCRRGDHCGNCDCC